MKRNRSEPKRVLAVLLLAVMTAMCLSACSGGATQPENRHPWRKPASQESEEPAAVQTPNQAPVQTPDENDPAPVQTPEKIDDPAPVQPTETTDDPAESQEPEQPAVNNTEANLDPTSVQGVARLGDLVGNYAMELFRDDKGSYIVVDTEDSHNPYDLTWRYGPDTTKQKEVNNLDWDVLYRSYVAACDWSLVFDAEYYKQAFPMLAKLYHDNDALLLEHFQTQGVHEGRQASADFNAAAYIANCDGTLVEAFGENYECYYFYYMLNQNTQKAVSTENPDGAYPRWLTLELSLQQSYEYKSVNSYRKEVNADPVEIEPEIISLANYRAWTDAEYNLHAHDWTTNTDNAKDINDVLWRLGRDHFAENTVKWYHTTRGTKFANFAIDYRYSPDHYKAMVSTDYHYFGCSNPYWSDNPDNPFAENGKTGYACQFDLFTASQPKTPYTLD